MNRLCLSGACSVPRVVPGCAQCVIMFISHTHSVVIFSLGQVGNWRLRNEKSLPRFTQLVPGKIGIRVHLLSYYHYWQKKARRQSLNPGLLTTRVCSFDYTSHIPPNTWELSCKVGTKWQWTSKCTRKLVGLLSKSHVGLNLNVAIQERYDWGKWCTLSQPQFLPLEINNIHFVGRDGHQICRTYLILWKKCTWNPYHGSWCPVVEHSIVDNE